MRWVMYVIAFLATVAAAFLWVFVIGQVRAGRGVSPPVVAPAVVGAGLIPVAPVPRPASAASAFGAVRCVGGWVTVEGQTAPMMAGGHAIACQ